jgi:hypothetical protein
MVNLDVVAARQVVVAHGLSTEDARRIGGLLKQRASAVRKRTTELQGQSATT